MSILSDAQIHLVFKKDSAFFAALMYQITWELNEDVPTAAINETKCKINPTWFKSLSQEERVGLMAHEIMHLVLMHKTRLGTRDPKRWNRAGDYLINYMLQKQGFTLPKGGLLDGNLNDSYTTEQIYELLAEDDEKESPQYNQPNGIEDLQGDSEDESDEGMSPSEIIEVEAKITQMVANAVTQAKVQDSAGSIPNGVELMLNEILYPKVPWHTILYQYFCEVNKDDYSTQRRNRRFRDVFVPALHSEGMGKISTYLDISCSVSDEQFAEQHAEMMHIKSSLNPSEIEIIEFDTVIKTVRKFTSEESIENLVFTGRGGTCLEEVSKRIAVSDAEVHVIFTDGYVNTDCITNMKSKDIVWCIIDNKTFNASHGKIIHLE